MTDRMTYVPARPRIGDIITNPRTHEIMGIADANWTDANRVCCGICFSDRIETREIEDDTCEGCGHDIYVPGVPICLDCGAENGPVVNIPYMTFAFSVRREFVA